jgi:hypothetical protein
MLVHMHVVTNHPSARCVRKSLLRHLPQAVILSFLFYVYYYYYCSQNYQCYTSLELWVCGFEGVRVRGNTAFYPRPLH